MVVDITRRTVLLLEPARALSFVPRRCAARSKVFSVEHDLFGKPVSTFPVHALANLISSLRELLQPAHRFRRAALDRLRVPGLRLRMIGRDADYF